MPNENAIQGSPQPSKSAGLSSPPAQMRAKESFDRATVRNIHNVLYHEIFFELLSQVKQAYSKQSDELSALEKLLEAAVVLGLPDVQGDIIRKMMQRIVEIYQQKSKYYGEQ